MKALAALSLLLATLSFAEESCTDGRWCKVYGSGVGNVYWTETKILSVGVQGNPLRPTYVVRLDTNISAPGCRIPLDQGDWRIAYISEIWEGYDDEDVSAYKISMSLLAVDNMVDMAQLAFAGQYRTRIAVNCDEDRKSVGGKRRHPIVRVVVIQHGTDRNVLGGE